MCHNYKNICAFTWDFATEVEQKIFGRWTRLEWFFHGRLQVLYEVLQVVASPTFRRSGAEPSRMVVLVDEKMSITWPPMFSLLGFPTNSTVKHVHQACCLWSPDSSCASHWFWLSTGHDSRRHIKVWVMYKSTLGVAFFGVFWRLSIFISPTCRSVESSTSIFDHKHNNSNTSLAKFFHVFSQWVNEWLQSSPTFGRDCVKSLVSFLNLCHKFYGLKSSYLPDWWSVILNETFVTLPAVLQPKKNM